MIRRLALTVALVAVPASASAAGFEVGSNTALSNARGGTGIVSKSDPSATTINPGRLPFSKGLQVLLGSNLVDLNVRFQREPLQRPNDTVEFDEASNQAAPFPVPYLAASWDLGLDNLVVGLSASGPHAYGRRCLTELDGGECLIDATNGARYMMVETNLIQVYFMASVAYALEFAAGKLGFGISGGPAYQQSNFTLAVDQVGGNVGTPYLEREEEQAVFNAIDLRDWQPVFVGGLAWEGTNGLRLGAAYQPGMKWNAKGKLDLELPGPVLDFVELQGDGLALSTKQAHRLSVGGGWATGTHPGVTDAPLFDVELNVVWEDWSRLEAFEITPGATLLLAGVQEQNINPVIQPKGYQDTLAVRLGSSYGVASFLTLHAGAFFETAAQKPELTNADFVSWDRYSGSLGATVHATDFLDVAVSYAFVGSPARTVENGEVYSQIPLSQCLYPDYNQSACEEPGTPPGNPQNEGEWHSSFHIAGLNLTGKF